MKHAFIFLLLLLLFDNLFAQNDWKTQFVTGAKIADYAWGEEFRKETFFFEFQRNWNRRDEVKVSLIKSFGMSCNYYSLDRESGGLGASTTISGSYIFSTVNLSVLVQRRIREAFIMQFGPRIEWLLAGYENSTSESGSVLTDPPTTSSRKVSELNRNYFRQPYFGPELKLLARNSGGAASAGLDLGYMWTIKDDSNFQTKSMLKVSFLLAW